VPPKLPPEKKKPLKVLLPEASSDPVGTRTQDPYIKSVLLYQLSYEIIKKELKNIKSRTPRTLPIKIGMLYQLS
jgi:hypothetical protein